ncbi:MAG: diguanylate cyclase [Rhodocyclaceae bacterium]|nr:diguanylate cyclase [Rhodocyclaceae bacterium]
MTPIDVSKFEQIKASADLPSPKGVALAIIQTAHRGDVSMAELARLVKTDPAFVGRLLKAANGINATGRRPVASVMDALVILGLPAVSGLALGFSLVSGQGEGACRNFDYQRFWSESLACAIAMEAINHRIRGITGEEAFCMGLVARIGELALATLFSAEYSSLLAEFRESGNITPLVDLEQREFLMDHCELSAAMLADWGLPKVFFEPVAYQENVEAASFPSGSRSESLARSLALARQLARVCLSAEDERGELMQSLFDLGLALGLGQEDVGALGDSVAEQWQSWGQMLELRSRHLPTLDDVTAAAQSAPVATGEFAGIAPLRYQASAVTRLKVLVVDDDPVMRALVRTVVVREGHEVFEAKNGKEGLDRALDLQPHMMIVDWLMPELDGMALTRALRQTRAGRGIYVLVLTSLEDDERLIEAFENDVDDYLAKPLKQRVLAARLRAGQRVVRLHQEIERDREEIRHFAAELAVSNRRLQEAALTDSLTGLPNRRFAMDRLQQEWATSLRTDRPLACLVIDLDEFKAINDTYGHDVGDVVLRQAALALKLGLREQDVLCRMGGDEFLAICPGSSLEQMLICAERVRLAVHDAPVSNGRLSLKITVSIGAAVRQPSMESLDALIKRADQSLYLAKERGRNCVAAV